MDYQHLVLLWAGHYLADFSLQTRFMSEMKARIFIEDIGIHALTAHAFVHGLVIGLLAQNFAAGVAVGSTHWLIDFIRSSEYVQRVLIKRGILKKKSDKLFGIHADQALHLLVIVIVVWSLS